MAQTHKSMIWQAGFDRGLSCASWQDALELGETIWTESEGRIIITLENWQDVFLSICWESEQNGRDFSPFEFTARELNDMQGPKDYDVWEVYESGIYAGFLEELKARREYYKE